MNIPIPYKAVTFVQEWEGFSEKPYLCPAGKWTIGYGLIKDPRTGENVTEKSRTMDKQEATFYLICELMDRWGRIKYTLPYWKFKPNMVAAILSFSYNIGLGAFNTSTAAKLMKKDPVDPNIRDAFMLFNKHRVAGDLVVSKGLVNRRTAEADLYFSEV